VSALPAIAPLRPVRERHVPIGRKWIYELKLDGFRGVLSIEGSRGAFTSKNGHRMRRFDELAHAAARALGVRSAILDGEIVAMRGDRLDFRALFFRRGAAGYAAFDLLWLNGRDLRALPLWRRKRALHKLVAGTPVAYVHHVDDASLFTEAVARDLEGVVAKRRHDPYGPETEWVKVKYGGYSQMERRWELFSR
jgi:bifunctional non-homologous end joining protein LigD